MAAQVAVADAASGRHAAWLIKHTHTTMDTMHKLMSNTRTHDAVHEPTSSQEVGIETFCWHCETQALNCSTVGVYIPALPVLTCQWRW